MKAWRKAQKLTQAKAAAKVHVSQATWCDLENGKKQPRIELALRLAEVSRDEEGRSQIPIESWSNSRKAA